MLNLVDTGVVGFCYTAENVTRFFQQNQVLVFLPCVLPCPYSYTHNNALTHIHTHTTRRPRWKRRSVLPSLTPTACSPRRRPRPRRPSRRLTTTTTTEPGLPKRLRITLSGDLFFLLAVAVFALLAVVVSSSYYSILVVETRLRRLCRSPCFVLDPHTQGLAAPAKCTHDVLS